MVLEKIKSDNRTEWKSSFLVSKGRQGGPSEFGITWTEYLMWSNLLYGETSGRNAPDGENSKYKDPKWEWF